MKEYKQNIKLIPYINKQLKAAGLKTDSDTRLAGYINTILQGINLTPVRNTNSHNYTIGVPIPIPSKLRIGSIDKGYGSTSMYVTDISLDQLIPGGNHLRGVDAEIEYTVSEDLYIRSLTLLRDFIDSELEYISKVNKGISEEDPSRASITDILKEAITQPHNKLDLTFISKLLSSLSTEEDFQSKKSRYT